MIWRTLVVCLIVLYEFKDHRVLAGIPPGLMPPTTCMGKWNTQQVMTKEPSLIRTVTNGKLYHLNAVTPPILVVHLWGSHYQMGFAMGSLLRNELKDFLPRIVTYGVNYTASYLVKYAKLPYIIARQVTHAALIAGLDETFRLTKPYTPQHFMDEIRGIADGSGMDYQDIIRINMVPELFKASCSFVGAWGPAIRDLKGSTLFQLRALDWAIDGPFNDYPALLVYHPDKDTTPGAHAFANWGYPGFVGAVTGYSSAVVGLSEKLDTLWPSNARGYPFHYMFRDILEFDADISAALDRMYNARRTVSIWVGLGDNATNQFRAVFYGPDHIVVYSDENYPESDSHPRIPGVIYNDPHGGPPGKACLPTILKSAYGSIDASVLINVTGADDTGDTHVAVYDYAQNYVYLAHTISPKGGPIVKCGQRPFVRVNMLKMWAEKPPMIEEPESEPEIEPVPKKQEEAQFPSDIFEREDGEAMKLREIKEFLKYRHL